MRFYTKQHKYYCGIDLHARTMYICILDQTGKKVFHGKRKASPESFLKVIEPYREDIAVAVECIFIRVRDGVLRRTIDKRLKAGVFEDRSVMFPDAGTPQGGVVSPLLANIYLHHVLDSWFEEVVRPRLMGRAFLIRYTDDVVVVFSLEEDARRVLDVLPKRLSKYGLSLHPEKTRLVVFRHPCKHLGRGKRPGTFDFLGFTHHWSRSFKGYWVVKRRRAKNRFRRPLKGIS